MTLATTVPENHEDITLSWFNRIFKPHGIKVHSFTFTGEVGQGRGMMGSLEQVVLEISRFSISEGDNISNDGDVQTEQLHIVLKTLPKNEFVRAFAANDGFTSREISMYTEVFPTFDKFLDSRDVSQESRYRHPICYYGAEERQGDSYKYILVLENLLAPGSDLHLRGPGFAKPLPWNEASAVIRQIARLHATGVAYKLGNHVNSYHQLFPKLMHVVNPSFDSVWENGFKIGKEVIKTTVDANDIPDGLFDQIEKIQEEESKQQLLKWFTGAENKFMKNLTTVCHHDLHANNLVISSDQSAAILFDYQASCVFNPMKDLSFFMVLNCDEEYATTKLSTALELYHDEFAATMTATKTDFKYSLETIEKDYDTYFAFSLTHVLSGAPVWITGPHCTEASKRRFAMFVINAYKKGILRFPLYDV